MSDDVIAAAERSMARTEPGTPAKDDGLPGTQHVRIRSIPHLSTERLERRAAHLGWVLFTPEGLHSFSESRRALIHLGMHRKAILHELKMREEILAQGLCSA